MKGEAFAINEGFTRVAAAVNGRAEPSLWAALAITDRVRWPAAFAITSNHISRLAATVDRRAGYSRRAAVGAADLRRLATALPGANLIAWAAKQAATISGATHRPSRIATPLHGRTTERAESVIALFLSQWAARTCSAIFRKFCTAIWRFAWRTGCAISHAGTRGV